MWTEGSSASSPFDVQSRDNFMVTAASMPATNTLDWPTAPRVNLAFQAARSWNNDIDYEATNEAMIPVYQSDPRDPQTMDTLIGYWDQVQCELPAAAFPSDRYELGVSNDGTLQSSPLIHVPFMEFALDMSAGSEIQVSTPTLTLTRDPRSHSLLPLCAPAYVSLACAFFQGGMRNSAARVCNV
jgi:hypothetical protein